MHSFSRPTDAKLGSVHACVYESNTALCIGSEGTARHCCCTFQSAEELFAAKGYCSFSNKSHISWKNEGCHTPDEFAFLKCHKHENIFV